MKGVDVKNEGREMSGSFFKGKETEGEGIKGLNI